MGRCKNECLCFCCGKVLYYICKELFFVFIILGVFVGFIIGLLVNKSVNDIKDLEKKVIIIMLIGFLGEFFMNMLKLLILLLIVVSLIIVLVMLDFKVIGRIGCWIVFYYMGIMLIVVFFGIVLVFFICLGECSKFEGIDEKFLRFYCGFDLFFDFLRWVLIMDWYLLY